MVCDSKGRDVQTYTHSQCACCNYRAKGAKHLLQCVVNAGMISGNRLTEHGQLSSSEHPLYALAVSSIHPCVMVAHSIHHKICRKTALSEMTDQLYLYSCNKHIPLSLLSLNVAAALCSLHNNNNNNYLETVFIN